MVRELKNSKDYRRNILFFSLMTLLFNLAASVVSVIFFPIAGAFSACLFLFESRAKRIWSYVIPVLSVAISILLLGIYGLCSIGGVVLGVILYFCYILNSSKAECSVYLIITAIILILLSGYLFMAQDMGNYNVVEVYNKFLAIVTEAKDFLTDVLYRQMTELAEAGTGTVDYDIVESTVDEYFAMLPGFLGVIAFAFAGVALKLYVSLVARFAKHGILKKYLTFTPSRMITVFYVIIFIASALTTELDIFGLVIKNLNVFLLVVFAYMGFKFLRVIGYATRKTALIYVVVAFAIISMTSTALMVLSLLGIYLSFVSEAKPNDE